MRATRENSGGACTGDFAPYISDHHWGAGAGGQRRQTL